MVTILATGVSIVIGTIAAYALARLRFPGVGAFGTGIFVTYLVPTSLLFLPLAQVINWVGLADSKWALVLTYPTFLVPFCTWLLMGLSLIHISEPTRLLSISYAVFCLKKKKILVSIFD